MRQLASYSDAIEKAPARLRALIEKDARIVGFTVEPDGVFIYTNSAEWDNGNGAGTFRGDTAAEAMRRYKQDVTRNDEGRE